jgi:hypothetical protein
MRVMVWVTRICDSTYPNCYIFPEMIFRVYPDVQEQFLLHSRASVSLCVLCPLFCKIVLVCFLGWSTLFVDVFYVRFPSNTWALVCADSATGAGRQAGCGACVRDLPPFGINPCRRDPSVPTPARAPPCEGFRILTHPEVYVRLATAGDSTEGVTRSL